MLKIRPECTTDQGVFNRVVEHLHKQRKRSIDGHWCRNQDEEGRRCAIACCFTDDSDVKHVSNYALLYTLEDQGVSSDLLHQLRDAHDSAKDNKFRKRLAEVGKRFGLSNPLLARK